MKENMISYYDLLTMIKNKQYPKVYWHNNARKKVLYIPSFDCVNGELISYDISNPNLEDENIRFYLSECMIESDMFDKCLEIKEDELDMVLNIISDLQVQLKKQKEIIDKAKHQINKFNKEEGLRMYEDTWNHLKQILEILEEQEK